MDVTGDPRIGIYVSNSTDYATYVASASQAAVLVFRYTVTGARDDDINGVHVNTNGLELNGGTIRNQGTTVDADITHDSLQGLPTHTRLVENIAITSTQRVAATQSGSVPTYGPGEVIEFTVTFGDTIDVSGQPILATDTPDGQFEAEYAGGTGSNTLRFEWTVPAALTERFIIRISANQVVPSQSLPKGLVLQGATLTDSGGRPVNIRHESMQFVAYADATPPALSNQTSGATVALANLTLIYRTSNDSPDPDWLDTTSTPAPGDFTVMVDGTEVAVATVEIADEETIRLTLSQPVHSGDVVTIDYTPGANAIKDLWGNETVAVNNRAVRNDTAASSDATLSALSVNDGTNDLILDPPFVSGTFAYTAEVDNAVTTVTLMAPTTDDRASISAVTLAGTAITDTDFTDGITVPSLLVGDNAIVVTVTAENGTTQPYTITVTRGVGTAATVTDVAFTSPPSDGVYDLGEIIEVSVTFSEAVAVTDAPRVRMGLVVSDAYAAYVASASTATVLVFRYTVTGATDDVPDGIRVNTNGLELNGGTIRNQGTTVDADLAHGAVTSLPMRTRLVEDIAITSTPRVPATDSGGTPTYGPGEVIEFTVTFGDTVEVTGTPILKGATSEAGQFDAEYAGGTGSEALRFEWTVPASLPAPAAILIYSNIIDGFGLLNTAFGLVLQGATLTDSGGGPVNIRHEDVLSLGTNVDAAPPVLSSLASGATVDGVRLELIYRRDATSQSADWLDTSSTPAAGDFTVTVDGTEVAVSTVEVVDEETVRLTLSEAVRYGDVVTIDYTPGANPIKDLWGNEAIALDGRAVRNDTAASTDATLESLTVHDGTSDLTLAPPFVPGTFAYTAEVDNAVTTVMLTAMTTDDGASVSAVTLDGTAIADTDFTDGITVPSLLVGDNAITVAVTAENGAIRPYTVTVTRAAADVGITIAANNDRIGAGLDDLVFTLSREGPTTDELEVTLTIVQDQLWLNAGVLVSPITFPAGSATMTQTFGVFTFSFDPAVSGNLTATVTGTGISSNSTIVNVISIAEPPITIAYDEIEYSFTEDGLPADINIYVVATLNPAYPRPPQHAFHVDVYSEEDTAIYLEDYREFGQTRQFGREDFALEGGKYVARKRVQSAGGIDFAVVNDAVYEGTERFFATLLHSNAHSGLVQFAYPDGDTCEASVCSPVVKYPVYITDEEDLPILSLSAYPISISEADDDTTPDITENVSTLDVAITNAKTFAKEQTFTLDFSGSAVYGTHYTVGPLDTDTTSPGHQAVLQAKTASAPITITALDNADVEGGHTIEVQGSLDGTTFVTGARITISDDDGTITPATITDVALTNLPSDGVYDLGEIVEVSITFSELVDVTGNPQVGMQVTDFKYADYVASASTAAVLVFHYTMDGTSDDDTDGITVFANGLEVIEGTIRNQGTAVNADLAHERVSGLPTSTRLIESITVTSTPNVPAIESGGDATYGPGEVIEFTVTFGDMIDVTGTPILHVDTTEHGQYEAEYTGGSGSTALRFEWTVPATPANYISLSISTNGAGTELIPSSGLDLENATLTDSGNRQVNVRHATVTNLATTDASPPVLSEDGTGATVNGTRLELIYRRYASTSEPDWLDMNSTPVPGDFTVTVDGTEVAVDMVEVADTKTVRLTLSQAVNSGDAVTVGYNPGTNPIKDLWGNEAIAVNGRAVRNDTAASTDATLERADGQ